jgi:uncharacterized membrane protein/acyl-CoA synthetase (AMP-forming)/AMP-acid ligase II
MPALFKTWQTYSTLLSNNFRRMVRIIVYAAAAIYPILVFCFLVILKIPTRYFSLFIVCIALTFFLIFTSGKNTSGKKDRFRVASAGLLAAAGLSGFLFNSSFFLKMYPILMNAVMLVSFGYTLFAPPPMIFRFAVLQDKKIRGSLAEKRIENYCRKVTMVWCAFFILNGTAAAWTVFAGSDLVWSLYNGGLSYILIGVLFAGELIVRKMTNKKMPKAVPLSEFVPTSRSGEHVICYERAWGDGVYKTWGDFLADTACLRRAILAANSEKWILHTEDCWYFLCAFTALLQCGREVWITANISPEYLAEIREENTAFLTDKKFGENLNILFIPDLLKDSGSEDAPAPINAAETAIMMYTSGSTGEPKVIKQRLAEFEADNRFVLSKWGEEWLSRKVCSTVSHHHIYGLLFGILLPFTAGVPFRRHKISAAEEFNNLTDTSYMLVTVPGFLKRAVELNPFEGTGRTLKNVWIYTSAGALDRETAEKTEKVFGFWPLEVYGSTETSGIAWRISRNGPEWVPFDNAEIRLNESGCLVVRSVYIKNPEGFTTADMAEMLPDGRFLLKGRCDSIVKVEEKRVSLNEIEERLRHSDLVSDACVIALEGKRQYLAAAVVLSEKGNEIFTESGKYAVNRALRGYLLRFLEPVAIPRKWRYVQALPADSQGKKKKNGIEALFGVDILKSRLLAAEKVIEQGVTEDGKKKAVVEFTVPEESGYFNEHFPLIRVLPGVAQFELAVRFANRYLGSSLFVKNAKKIKFTSPVRPDVPLRMELVLYAELVEFTVTSPDGGKVYSSGNFLTGNSI